VREGLTGQAVSITAVPPAEKAASRFPEPVAVRGALPAAGHEV